MILTKLEEILKKLESVKADAEKSQAGNASAGRRVRKICMEATKDLKELRSLILESIKK